MTEARSPWIAIGALNAAIAIAAGAFAAHGLRDHLEAHDAHALEVFETGARYQMYHAFALILASILARPTVRQLAGWLFLVGIVLFCGSLYAIALTGVKGFGAVAPIGGLAFIAGWLWLAWTAWRR